jgi:tetratricopeptide (TPR) repeat protein
MALSTEAAKKVLARRADWRVGGGIFVAALALYLVTAGRAPVPGRPLTEMWAHLALEAPPPVDYPVWGWLVRLTGKFPRVSPVAVLHVLSVVCGAVGAALTAMLLGRARFRGRLAEMAVFPAERVALAQKLSGWFAGLFLMVSAPFWMAATRSGPDMFDLCLLLVSIWLLMASRQRGRLRYFGGLGVLCGVGLVESGIFWLFLPVVAVWVLVVVYRRGAGRRLKPHLLFWGGLAAGLGALPLHLLRLARRYALAGQPTGMLELAGLHAVAQLEMIQQFSAHVGMLLILTLALAPWLLLFVASKRSPWHYDTDQILARVVWVGALLVTLFDWPISLWQLDSLRGLLLPAHVLLASSVGLMAGEFSLVAARQIPRNSSWVQWGVRVVCGGAVWLTLVVILTAGALNWRMVDTRPARVVFRAVEDILKQTTGRPVMLTGGGVGDVVAYAAWRRGQPLLTVDARQVNSSFYCQKLARHFDDPFLRQALERGHMGTFFTEWLWNPQGLAQTAFLEWMDPFYEMGYLVPRGYVCHLAATEDEVDWAALARRQRGYCRRWLSVLMTPKRHPLAGYMMQLRRLLARNTNNLGVSLARRGDDRRAMELFRWALEVDPDNLSARMNWADVAREDDPQLAARLEAEWERRIQQPQEMLWGMDVHSGHLLNAVEWARRDAVWALSGQLLGREAQQRQLVRGDLAGVRREVFLDLVYLAMGRPTPDEYTLRTSLIRNERNISVFQKLTRLALRRGDPDAAEIYLQEALRLGLPMRKALLDQCMIAFVREGRTAAEPWIPPLIREDGTNPQIWVAQALWELEDFQPGKASPALNRLYELGVREVSLHLSMAWVHMARLEWNPARLACEEALKLEPDNAMAWELLWAWARAKRRNPAMQRSIKALTRLEPAHPLLVFEQAAQTAREDKFDEAEAMLRRGVRHSRESNLLYGLAGAIMQRLGNLDEACALLDEAIARQPFRGTFVAARRECLALQEKNQPSGRAD